MERLTAIASESKLLVLLVDSTTASECPLFHTLAEPVNVSNLDMTLESPVPNHASPTQTAVIMFTSGSTGTPKGIAIGHAAYAHHVESFSHTWGIRKSRDIVLHQSS